MKLLEQKIRTHKDTIDAWFYKHAEGLSDPIYASVDLRNAGFKIAPIDTNLFPAGWNNLCHNYAKKAGELFREHIRKYYPETHKILIVPENHSKNTYYLANIRRLQQILEENGFEVVIGTLREDVETSITLETAEHTEITQHKIHNKDGLLIAGDFDADIYLLNNDLSSGIPDILKNLKKPLIPSPLSGWHTRRKSDHFKSYDILSQNFASAIDIDSWLICTYFNKVEGVDFATKEGLNNIAEVTETILQKTQKKYDEYGITEKPYVFIKNEVGTYGMAAMTAENPDDILNMNRKQRNSMNVGKENIKVNHVIIQEGIQTVDQFEGKSAEPVMYLVNNQVAGGFLRLHEAKGTRDNLNSPGMRFIKMCLHEMKNYKNTYDPKCDLACIFDVFTVLAKLASIAAGYEIKQLIHTNKKTV